MAILPAHQEQQEQGHQAQKHRLHNLVCASLVLRHILCDDDIDNYLSLLSMLNCKVEIKN